ncbi:hypothetical protein BDY17DRAFT_314185 [Neohortaea acidophila]|uniref:Zn(2)-C6 fungal-type domain-containing protein n=1 Tax=Neohortaea acidophila TaxID=245834 RepID=A0A6A6PGT6_9PEZI|nr:uncharacterized protein BDY17DRAFT_314185 [Neohortaea acidophila]KAF2478507.1 hypothetical protein BDY17DRAFT_314185 [Neohortaea acidophila]
MASMSKQQRTVGPSALACTACRLKHLKCDRTSPPCTRCARHGLACKYTPSRRGLRRTPDHANQQFPVNLPQQQDSRPLPFVLPPTPSSVTTGFIGPDHTLTGLDVHIPSVRTGLAAASSQPTRRPPGEVLGTDSMSSGPFALSQQDEDHLVNLYYYHFHPVHPVLLPHSRFNKHAYPSHLRLVVQLIGSRYTSAFASDTLKEATATSMTGIAKLETDPVHLIQSLLLYAIYLHASTDRSLALSVCAKASDLALEIGLHRADYVVEHGAQGVLLDESLRRTWWELFVLDGYFAALHRQMAFRCNAVEVTAQLPCEERWYCEGLIPPEARTLEQFDRRYFADGDEAFSSACYRIDSIRILGRVLAVAAGPRNGADDARLIDNAIVAWKLHLPLAKAGALDCFGNVDPIMLQAHAYISMAGILLHFPRSELLLTGRTAADIACAARLTQAFPTSAQHAAKAILASKDLADLANLAMGKHSPLFACSLVFGCIVQLSTCSADSHDGMIQGRDRVALMTGALKSIHRHWDIAGEVLRPLNKLANAVFSPQHPTVSIGISLPEDAWADVDAMLGTASWLDFFPTADIGGRDRRMEGMDEGIYR